MQMPTRSPGNTPSEARACAAAAASAWSWRNVSDSLPLKTAALSGTADSVCSNCAGIVVNCLERRLAPLGLLINESSERIEVLRTGGCLLCSSNKLTSWKPREGITEPSFVGQEEKNRDFSVSRVTQ